MADKKKRELHRKHCGIDLDQVVIKVDIYKRPLYSVGSKSGAVLGFVHEAAVATTENGGLYLIEKGVSPNDDINFPARYREGECRIVEITRKDIRDWKLIRPVGKVDSGITLEDLFDSCGSDYGLATDNCWNGTHRIRAKCNPDEDGMTWQEKGAVGVGVGVGIAAAVGILAFALSGNSKEKEKAKQ
ncbi:hypothetical protein BOX15_Mlig022102g3 [Macrostomum lignano]|uniref:Uncharacterized protein n=1 Tax=Macrostomum lignano TaxID=282301 RepID=A0A267H728_9PLAT|nr:hypothetical protein BOX15_Mlig022102g3 [Macrostomum lignano]